MRAGAAWELARWHAFRGDAEATLHCLGLIPPLDSSRRLAKGKLLLEVPALLASGDPDEAESIAFGALSRFANDHILDGARAITPDLQEPVVR